MRAFYRYFKNNKREVFMKITVNGITNILAVGMTIATAASTILPQLKNAITLNADGSINIYGTALASIIVIVLYYTAKPVK